MSTPAPSRHDYDSIVATCLEPLVRRFDEAWQRGERLDIETLLPVDAENRRIVRIELIHLELELRLKAGEAVRVEEYLTRFPELAHERQVVLELLLDEWRMRARTEPSLSVEEYRRRFPEFASELMAASVTLPLPKDPHRSPATEDLHSESTPSTVSEEMPQLPGYAIQTILGHGGMGVVYKAKQLALRRTVALKMILGGRLSEREERHRFFAEALALARLPHPNIVQIHEIGEYQGQPFLALEYVEGGTLAERLARAPLAADEAARLTAILARAVQVAHDAGIVHRDLKPANILLTNDGTPKIGDFGLAKHLDADTQRTHSGAILGTAHYMSPEQASGKIKEIGPPTDIYGLGVVLFEMLAGRPPFRGTTNVDVLHRVMNEEPASVRRFNADAPRDLETICHKCLQKEPARRYRSALELAEDLDRFSSGEPILARRSSAWERGVKWARRRPAFASLLCLLLLSLTSAALIWIYKTVQLQQALDDRTRELRSEQEARVEVERRQRRDLSRQLYIADMRDAVQFWRAGDFERCFAMLEAHLPQQGEEDFRSFEWRWLLHESKRQRTKLELSPRNALCVVCSTDGKRLASANDDGSLALWDAAEKRLLGIFGGHKHRIATLAFSVDGRKLTSASVDGVVKIWDVAECRELDALSTCEGICHLTLDGRFLVVASSPNNLRQGHATIRRWDMAAKRELPPIGKSTTETLAVRIAPNGSLLALQTRDRNVKVYDAVSGRFHFSAGDDKDPYFCFAHRLPLFALATHAGEVLLLDASTGRRVAAIPSASTKIRFLAFSPDDRLLVSTGEDGSLNVWDLHSQRAVGVFRGHRGEANSAGFAPSGETLFSTGSDRTIRIWDTNTSHCPWKSNSTFRPAGPLAFSSDGRLLIAAGVDASVHLIDCADARTLRVLRGWYGACRAVAFSPDNGELATAGDDGRIRLWDKSSGQMKSVIGGNNGPIQSLAYSPDGRWLASAAEDGRIGVWRRATGQLAAALEGQAGTSVKPVFSGRGEILAAVVDAKTIRLWNIPSFQRRADLKHDAIVSFASFLRDGKTLMTYAEGSHHLWDSDAGKEKPRVDFSENPGSHFDLACDCDVLARQDGTGIYLSEASSNRISVRIQYAFGNAEGTIALSPNGKTLAVARRDAVLQLWDRNTWKVRDIHDRPPASVRSLSFSPDGNTLVGGTSELENANALEWKFLDMAMSRSVLRDVRDTVRGWRVVDGSSEIGLPHADSLVSHPAVAFAPDGQILASGADDGSVSLWDRSRGERRARLLVSRRSRSYLPQVVDRALKLGLPIFADFESDRMRALAFSPDGQLLVAACIDGLVQLWHLPSGRQWTALPGEFTDISCLVFSPDSRALAVPNGSQIEIWDVADRAGQPRRSRTIRGPEATVRCLAFSRDGRWLASGSDDWNIHLRRAETGEEVSRFQGHTARVSALAFSADGKTLASGSWDGTVRLWHREAGRELVTMKQGSTRIHTVAFSPAGDMLAAGGERTNGRGEVWIWKTEP